MKRLLMRIAVALLTFSVGYSLFLAVEIYNLKVEILEYERRVESDGSYEAMFEDRLDRFERRQNICIRVLRERKKKANASNMARCLDELQTDYVVE